MNCTVRAARMSDCGQIAELAVQLGYDATPEGIARRLAETGTISADVNPEYMQSASNVVTFVAVDGEHVLGWGNAQVIDYIFHEPFAEILGLVVRDGFRGSGVGRILVAAVEQWATGIGLRTMTVRSNAVRKEAHAFYIAIGYTKTKDQSVFRKELS